MIYTLIISLLIEKLFYLLRPQSFSFQIVSNTQALTNLRDSEFIISAILHYQRKTGQTQKFLGATAMH